VVDRDTIGITLVQAFDAAIGLKLRRTMETLGPAITSMLNFAALIWLLN
jgi:hypothetical protein